MALPVAARVSVHRDIHRLAVVDMGEFGFLQVGGNPQLVADQAHRAGGGEGRHGGDDERAGLQAVHFADRAGKGRAHHGMVQLALGFIHRGFGFHVAGRLFHRNVHIAIQLGELGGRVLGQRCLCRLGAQKRGARLVHLHGGDGVLPGQRLVARVSLAVDTHLGGLGADLGLGGAVHGAGGFHVLHRRGKRGLGILQRDFEGLRIQREQHLPSLHFLAFMHVHGLDQPGHVRRDHQLVGMDIGIVRRHIAAAVQIEERGDGKKQPHAAEHQHLAQGGPVQAAAGGRRFTGGIGGVGSGHSILPPPRPWPAARWSAAASCAAARRSQFRWWRGPGHG